MNDFEGSKLFLNVPAKVAYDRRLKDKDKLIMGEIVSMLNVTGKFFMSNSKIAERLNCTTRSVMRSLDRLEETGYIKRDNVYQNKQIVKREISLGSDRIFTGVVTQVSPGWRQECHQGSDTDVTDNRTSNRTINRTSNIYSPAKSRPSSGKPDNIPFNEIVDYLNKKTSQRYRASSQKTRRLIKARFNEGFSLDDFKHVIDTKTADWLKDEKMSRYLRPETLFGTKFENYLNEKTQRKEIDSQYDLF